MATSSTCTKKSGKLKACIDYWHLNINTSKDAYPLTIADEVQDHLVGSTILFHLTFEADTGRPQFITVTSTRLFSVQDLRLGLFQFKTMPLD